MNPNFRTQFYVFIAVMALIVISLLNCRNTGKEQTKRSEVLTFSDTSRIILQKKSQLTHYINIKTEKDSSKTYNQTKTDILKIKNSIDLDLISEDSLSKIFTETLVNKLIPYWYGTSWDFNGYTAVPNTGYIACGYFISTIFEHMGFNINRYKLAQQLPINEAKTLTLNTELIEIEIINQYPSDYIETIQDTIKEGIYFIGFDSGHVGFILNNGDQLYLIHSNYLQAQGVMIERIENSNVYPMYSRFYFAEISTNIELLEKWVKGEEIIVVKQNN